MIISNTSPIIFLLKIEKLDLLHQQFGTVVLPEAVVNEIKNKRENTPEVRCFDGCGSWFKIMTPKKMLPLDLGAGETAAISLAVEEKTRLLIIDDYQGRRCAQRMEIPIIGTAGLLIHWLKEKKIGYSEFKNLLARLIQSGFRMKIELYEQIVYEAEKYNENAPQSVRLARSPT